MEILFTCIGRHFFHREPTFTLVHNFFIVIWNNLYSCKTFSLSIPTTLSVSMNSSISLTIWPFPLSIIFVVGPVLRTWPHCRIRYFTFTIWLKAILNAGCELENKSYYRLPHKVWHLSGFLFKTFLLRQNANHVQNFASHFL